MSILVLAYAALALGVMSLLVSGVFLSFSDFVMRGLTAASARGGAQSMQMINITVMRSLFIVLLLGLAPLGLLLAGISLAAVSGLGRIALAAAAGLYALSVFAVTLFGNVPLNNRLAGMDPGAPHTAQYWGHYAKVWTRWNHVRTAGSLAAGIIWLVAAMELGASSN